MSSLRQLNKEGIVRKKYRSWLRYSVVVEQSVSGDYYLRYHLRKHLIVLVALLLPFYIVLNGVLNWREAWEEFLDSVRGGISSDSVCVGSKDWNRIDELFGDKE